MDNINKMITLTDPYTSTVVSEIKALLDASRQKVASQVNQALISTYWNIGEIIIKYEQNEEIRAEYGKSTLKQLSKALTKEFGNGFSVSNIQFMRRFI